MACCVDDLFIEEKDKSFNHYYYLKFLKPGIRTAVKVVASQFTYLKRLY